LAIAKSLLGVLKGTSSFHSVFCLRQAFADAYSILEKELFEASATDGTKVEDSFNLLQKIIPSFVGK
jgi:hypothetical protein